MWRLRKLVQKLWLALIGGMGFGVLANIIYEGLKGRGFRLHPDVIAFVLRFSPWFGIGLTAILVISLLSIISTRRKKVRESLQQAFEVFKPARELHPADLGFQVLSTGVPAGPHFRPYYSAYVTRKVVPHRQVLAGSSVPLHTEEDLLRALREGRGILILGRPLEGKTRTVFEIARRMDGYHVLSPRSDRPIPADDTFSLLRRQRVLLLLEDLNDYVGATLNLSRFCKKLDQYASAWAIAATCRDGPELEAVRKAWGSSLGRVYEGIPLKTALLPLVEEEKERLAREIGRKWDPGEGDASPTPGAIVMGGALEAMHRRFMVQPPEEKEILRALKLLMASGILPLTHHRLQVALREVFNLQVPDLNHSLELLATQAFLHEPGWQDPIQAEPAYLSDVVDYSAGKGTSDDFFLLVRAFSELGDAEALFYLGATYATTLEDYRQALHCFDEVLTHMPDSIDAWNNKGTMLWHLDLKQDAIQAWDRALALKPDESDVWFNKGIALEDTGRATEALASYDRALELNPSSSDVWGNKCVLLNELGRSQEALDACTKALEIEPDSPEYWSNKASALIGLARHEDALVASEEALRIAPAHAGALNNKAAALSGLGRYDEAVLALSRALELEPDDPQLWHNLGLAEAYLEHQKEALSAFDHAVQLNPADHEAWYNRGTGLALLGRHQEALEAFEQALDLVPDYVEALHNKEVSLGALGLHEDALEVLDQLVKLNPNDPNIWNNRGVTLLRLGRNQEALAAFDFALELNPNHPSAWTGRAGVLVPLGRHQEAIVAAKRAIELAPHDPDAWNNKGLILYNLGCYRKAVKACKRAIALNRNHYGAWHNIGMALFDLGRARKALDAFDHALDGLLDDPETWYNRALALESLGRYREAAVAYDRARDLRLSSSRSRLQEYDSDEHTAENASKHA